ATVLGDDLLERVDIALEILWFAGDRRPAIVAARYPLEGLRPARSQEYWRSGFLDGLGVATDCWKLDQLALVAGLRLRRQCSHCFDRLAQPLPAFSKAGSHRLGLFTKPSAPNSKHHAAARDDVQGRDRLGGDDRFAFGEQADSGAELDSLRDRRGGAER